MPINENLPHIFKKVEPWLALIIIGVMFMVALVISQLLVVPIIGFEDILLITSNPDQVEGGKMKMYLIQGLSSVAAFALVPILYLRWVEKTSLKVLFAHTLPNRGLYWAIFLLAVIATMMSSSVLGIWNMNMELSEGMREIEWLKNLEDWMRSTEDNLADLTAFLTTFDGIGDLLVALLVIAVIPAIGEELLFRGLIQNIFWKLLGNPHAAIWFSAFLFSFLHLQFYGFFPRFALGVAFGYMMYWSGNLWIPIIAHFINNGLAILLSYFGLLESESEVQTLVGIATLIATIGIMLYFKKQNLIEEDGVAKSF